VCGLLGLEGAVASWTATETELAELVSDLQHRWPTKQDQVARLRGWRKRLERHRQSLKRVSRLRRLYALDLGEESTHERHLELQLEPLQR
jgi:hypothetical protein